MLATENRQLRLAARPAGLPKPSDWKLTTEGVRDPAPGEVVVQVLYLSLDPAMRGWMNDARSYIPPVGIGHVMRAAGVGRVVASEDPAFAVDDLVSGGVNAQAYATVPGGSLTHIDGERFPLPVYLNVLGLPGMTAYFGLLDVGRPQAGETVVVSGAGGAVGMAVGQIAKVKGCRVVGIAGGPEKCAYAKNELGFDAAIDYKSEDVAQSLRRECKDGIDVYFDNVGGSTLDACLAQLRLRARVVLCGAISQYNSTTGITAPKNYLSLLVNRALMQGFIVFDFAARYPEAVRELSGLMESGKLKSREDVVSGSIDTFPDALLKLFSGENFGKLVLKLAEA